MGQIIGAIMINVTPNESLLNNFSWPSFNELYESVIDSSFAVLGRDITLHLTPVRSVSSGILQSDRPQLQYNPHLGRAPRPAPFSVSSSRTPAVQHTYRDVTYKAHIVHGPREISDTDVIGRLEVDQVATTLVVEASDHVREAESATIDGRRYKLHKNPRPIGLQQRRYTIVIWEEIPEKENG